MFFKERNVWLLTSLCVLSVCTLGIVQSHSREISSIPKTRDSAASVIEAKLVSPTQTVPDVVLVSLLPTGFEPSEVIHPAEKFLFGVNNRSGLDDLRFQLTDERGRQLGEKQMVREKIWRKLIEPKPGRYVLRVVGHPSWLCQVVITP